MAQQFGQDDVNKYRKFRKVDGATYRKVNQFLRKRTYITAREWAIAASAPISGHGTGQR